MEFDRYEYEQQSSDGYKTGILIVSFARPVSLEHATAYLEESAAKGNSTVLWVRPERPRTMSWERQESGQESAERIDPYNGETDKHYRRAGDLRGFCACGERFTEEHLASLTDGWHDTDDQGNPVCWCGESAEFVNAASDASPEHPCCEKHVQDSYRAIEEPTRVGTFNPLIPDDVIDWDQESQESQESAPLVNGCNLEACLTYAHERIAALESERDALQVKVSSALAAIERWTTLGHAPAVTADLRARLEDQS
jgi:hypothetical protein